MENPVCVDTDLIIDHLRGRLPGAELFSLIITRYEPCTTYISRFELLCGASTAEEREIIEECLLGFKIIPFDELSSNEAVRIYRELRQEGQLIGIRDILIAGIVLAHNLDIATRNVKDFKRIKRLSLWAE
ncbi:MAG: type II toxin-antitoxin system VapC family toxin [Deltaproteobacteria bacterium]|nr:type II toxin-antitoxin system VapC family toxin [Deltaproteobacteria bacterium]